MPVIEDPVGLPLDRILFATDFDAETEAASGYATALAKRFASVMTLVHVVDLSVATKSEDAVVGFDINQLRSAGAENMERSLNSLTWAGVKASGQTIESHLPGRAITDLASQMDADMIVLGTHARKALSKLILGSCSENVIRHATCPVLTIGPNSRAVRQPGFAFDTVVFATDLQHNSIEKAGAALSFAQEGIGKVYLCHILKHPAADYSETLDQSLEAEASLQRLLPSSAYTTCSAECDVEYGNVEEHILALAQRVRADLIVLGAHRSATWFAQLSGGVVGAVIGKAECPVMTICPD